MKCTLLGENSPEIWVVLQHSSFASRKHAGKTVLFAVFGLKTAFVRTQGGDTGRREDAKTTLKDDVSRRDDAKGRSKTPESDTKGRPGYQDNRCRDQGSRRSGTLGSLYECTAANVEWLMVTEQGVARIRPGQLGSFEKKYLPQRAPRTQRNYIRVIQNFFAGRVFSFQSAMIISNIKN